MDGDKVKVIQKRWQKGCDYKDSIDLYSNVEVNNNMFIGRQWEGVDDGGELPHPCMNFIKRVVLYLIASCMSDSVKLSVSALGNPMQPEVENPAAGGMGGMLGGMGDTPGMNRPEISIDDAVNAQFERIAEKQKLMDKLRGALRNAAVDGDGAVYLYWDEKVRTGQPVDGDMAMQIVENTRVHFGDPSSAEVQEQPWIIIESRETVASVRARAVRPEDIKASSGDNIPGYAEEADAGKVTVLLMLWKGGADELKSDDDDTGVKTGRDAGGGETIWAVEITSDGKPVREEWDTMLTLYPVAWMRWDTVKYSMHGQAVVTGLVPNQVFINKALAQYMLTVMLMGNPKIIVNERLVRDWNNSVGQIIGVKSGADDMNQVAKVLSGAEMPSTFISFIDNILNYTKELMGASDAALGNVRPDNTSAILALQRASSVPLELVKQQLYQFVEDLGLIQLDFMRAYYGTRYVNGQAVDFSQLEDTAMTLALDVGASSYWSEIQALTSLDNLLAGGYIDFVDYLERLPSGIIPKKQELIELARGKAEAANAPQLGGGMPPSGNGMVGAAQAVPAMAEGLPPQVANMAMAL